MYNISEDCRYQEIQCDQLSPGKVYVLDVQARMKDYDFESEWSKWSVGVECICPYTKDQGRRINKLIRFTGILCNSFNDGISFSVHENIRLWKLFGLNLLNVSVCGRTSFSQHVDWFTFFQFSCSSIFKFSMICFIKQQTLTDLITHKYK